MFKSNKLTKEELAELRARTMLINQYHLVTEALRLQTKVYTQHLLKEHGADIDGGYNIDMKTGRITKVKKAKI